MWRAPGWYRASSISLPAEPAAKGTDKSRWTLAASHTRVSQRLKCRARATTEIPSFSRGRGQSRHDLPLHARKVFLHRGCNTATRAEGSFQDRLTPPGACWFAHQAERLPKVAGRSPPLLSPLGAPLGRGSRARAATGQQEALRLCATPDLPSPPGPARPGRRASRRGRPEGPAGAESGCAGRHVCSARRNASAVRSSIRGAGPASCLLFFPGTERALRGPPRVPAGVAPAGLGSGKRDSTAPRSSGGEVPPAGSLGPRHPSRPRRMQPYFCGDLKH